MRVGKALAFATVALAATCCRLPRAIPQESTPFASEDFGIEITDARHRVNADMWVDTNAVRIDDSLYFVYLTSIRSTVARNRVFVRRLDLVSKRLDPPVQVFNLAAPYYTNHNLPSLARDGAALWVLLPFQTPGRNVSHLGCAEDPRGPAPQQSCGLSVARRIPDLRDPRSWTPDLRGLPMRMRNTFGFSHMASAPGFAGLRMIDWISAYDAQSRTGYAVGQMHSAELDELPGAMGKFDGIPTGGGFPVGLVRFLPDSRVDGPYMITNAESNYPGGEAGRCNIMTKPMLRLGRVVGARRRLHLFWANRCRLIEGSFATVFDPSYAFSDDGGRSWTNFGRNAVRSFPQRIAWNDRAYRLLPVDVEISTEGGFQVTDDDTIHYLFRRADPPGKGAPAWRDPREGGRLHAAAEVVDVPRDLMYLRCRPGETCQQIALLERSVGRRDQLAVASDGTLFAFLEWPLRYRKSLDGGRTWSEAVRIGPPISTWRLHANPDYADRDLLHLVFQTSGGDPAGQQIFYVRFDLRER